jgi:uncharacterized membrane protein
MINLYLLLKLLHIFAVIVFMGNLYTGLFWMKQADKTNDPNIISFTMKNINKSDQWFTVPGVIIITSAGFLAAIYASTPLLRTGWIFWPIVLFTLSGIIFSARLIPLQKKIYRLSAAAEKEEFDWKNYRQFLGQWEWWGHIALLMPVISLVMMVLKIPLTRGF